MYTTMSSRAEPLVSCICVTRNKPAKLRRAINCFKAQTYINKELVILYETDDSATHRALGAYDGDTEIAGIGVDVAPKKTLGELRNLAIEHSRGEYFCQWDDDDWYHTSRITEQLRGVMTSHQSASILTNWVMFDSLRERAYFSSYRLWEGSILCRKDVLALGISYPSMPRMEDGFFINELVEKSRVYPMPRPELYIYEVHAANTWNQKHFELLFALAQPLSPQASAMVARIMAGEPNPAEASQWMSSRELLGELTYFYVNNFTHTNRQLEQYRKAMLEATVHG